MRIFILSLIFSGFLFAECKYENSEILLTKTIKKCQPIADGEIVDCTIFEGKIKNKKNAIVTGNIFLNSNTKLEEYCFNTKKIEGISEKARVLFDYLNVQVVLNCDKSPVLLIIANNKKQGECK